MSKRRSVKNSGEKVPVTPFLGVMIALFIVITLIYLISNLEGLKRSLLLVFAALAINVLYEQLSDLSNLSDPNISHVVMIFLAIVPVLASWMVKNWLSPLNLAGLVGWVIITSRLWAMIYAGIGTSYTIKGDTTSYSIFGVGVIDLLINFIVPDKNTLLYNYILTRKDIFILQMGISLTAGLLVYLIHNKLKYPGEPIKYR